MPVLPQVQKEQLMNLIKTYPFSDIPLYDPVIEGIVDFNIPGNEYATEEEIDYIQFLNDSYKKDKTEILNYIQETEDVDFMRIEDFAMKYGITEVLEYLEKLRMNYEKSVSS